MDASLPPCAVCGGRVHEYEEIAVHHSGDLYYFCSDEHKEEFGRVPEKFV